MLPATVHKSQFDLPSATLPLLLFFECAGHIRGHCNQAVTYPAPQRKEPTRRITRQGIKIVTAVTAGFGLGFLRLL